MKKFILPVVIGLGSLFSWGSALNAQESTNICVKTTCVPVMSYNDIKSALDSLNIDIRFLENLNNTAFSRIQNLETENLVFSSLLDSLNIKLSQLETRVTALETSEPEPTPEPEPTWTKVTERFFNAAGEDGWGTGSGRNRYVSDTNAPVDPPTVVEMPFGPCSNCGGHGFGNQIVKNWLNDGSPTGREVRIEGWHKWSDNWNQNPSQFAKLLYVFDVGDINNPVILGAFSRTQGALAPQYVSLRLQGQDNTGCGENFSLNINSNNNGLLPRGEWVHIVTEILHNSPGGTCDARARVWVNGQLAIDRTGFRFRNADYTRLQEWAGINFAAVWGGGRGDIPSEQTIRTAFLRAYVR